MGPVTVVFTHSFALVFDTDGGHLVGLVMGCLGEM